MAIVGEARIMVTAFTDPFSRQIAKDLNGVARMGIEPGRNLGRSFMRGFRQGAGDLENVFTRTAKGLGTLSPNADRARASFASLSRTSYVAGTAVSALVGSIGSLIGGLGAFGGAAAGAAASLASIGSAGFAAVAGLTAAKLALSGVGAAFSALNKKTGGGGGGGGGGDNGAAAEAAAAAREAANRRVEDAERSLALVIERNREQLIDANNAVRDAQLALNQAIIDGREEIQQLGFDAEDAALSEQKAALELEKAREQLARVQDLPPNSRVRREAELAYQEAELNYRRAKDSATDLAKEQDRLAKTGVAGTEGVIDATKDLADAEVDKARTVRDALREQEEAERSLADAKKDAAKADAKAASAASGGGGGSDPFAGLNSAQIAFVKGLQELKDEFDELEQVAAENFLPPLLEALNILFDRSGVVFPVFRDGIATVAAGMGSAAVSIAKAVAESGNLADLASSLAQSGPLLATMGDTIGNAWGVAITLIERAFPIAQRYFDFLNGRLDDFDAWLDTPIGKSKTEEFFQKSADSMAQFGRIFDNIFGGIGAIVMANLGPGTGGGYLLTWLETATQKFDDLDSTAEGAQGLQDYFLGAATNMQKMFSSIGALLAEIVKIGDNPAIGQMWDTLALGAPILGSIIEKMVEAGPVAAQVVVAFLEIVDIFTDTVSAEVFFGTLLEALTAVRDFLNNDLVKAILAVVGPLLAMSLAFGVIGRSISFFGNVAIGGLKAIIAPIGLVVGWVAKASQFFAVLTYTGGPLAAAIGRVGFALMNILKFATPVLAIIGLLVTGFMILYKHNEDFRNSVDGMVAALIPVLNSLMGTIMQVFAAIQPVIQEVIQTLMQVVVAVAPTIIDSFQRIIQAILPLIPLVLNTLIPAFLSIIQTIAPLIPMIIQSLVPAIGSIISAVLPAIAILIGGLVPALANVLEAILPVVAMIIELLVPVIVQLLEAIIPVVTVIIDALVPAIASIVEAIVPLIVTIADGLSPLLTVLVGIVVVVINILVELAQQIISFLVPIIQFLVAAFRDYLMPIIKNVIELIKNLLMPIISGITTVMKGVIDFITGVFTGDWQRAWNGLVGIFRGIVNTIIGIFEGMVNFIIGGINNFIGALNGAAGFVSDITGGAINISVPKIGRVSIPRLADGGTVYPSKGGSIVNVAEAGKPERIEPLDKDGLSRRDKAMIDYLSNSGTGTTINVYQQPGEDGEALARRISRILSSDMRMGATL